MFFTKRKGSLCITISLLILFFLYLIILSHKINLVTADLGRHIVNGQYFFIDKKVLNQNFYSYTNSDFSTINHHWAVGVLFYIVYQFAGFTGLQLLFISTSLLTYFIFLFLAKGKNNWLPLLPFALFSLPLLAERTEIRPEIFSNLFAGLVFLLLFLYRENKLSFRWLIFIPLIEILWVNMHIYFFLGPLLIGCFFLESLIRKNKDSLILLILFTVTCLSTILNPFGLTGSLAPINEFKNYGYLLFENQSVSYIESYFSRSMYYIFKAVLGLLAISFIFVITIEPKKFSISHLLIGLFVSYMAWTMIRNQTLFALFSLPLIFYNFESIKQKLSHLALFVNKKPVTLSLSKSLEQIILITISLLFLAYYLLGNRFQQFPYWREFGFGLETESNASANFFIDNQLEGPIYNNYDNGGYLIFHLFPKEKVYVDNRPEAYPSSFFTDEYIPSQEKEGLWQKFDDKYHFNTIFFSYSDLTPWGQNFIKNRFRDPEWATVFIDKYNVILLRQNAKNQSIISQFKKS